MGAAGGFIVFDAAGAKANRSLAKAMKARQLQNPLLKYLGLP